MITKTCYQLDILTKLCVFSIWALFLSLPFASNAEIFRFSPTMDMTQDSSFPTLKKSGEAVRKQFFFKIYTVTHYMDWPSTPDASNQPQPFSVLVSQILSGQYLQQIEIVFARDLKAEQIKSALAAGVKRNCTHDQYTQISASLTLFIQGITEDAKKGKHFRLRWQPDGRLQAVYEGQTVIDIVDPLFARLLWSVWFGEDAVIDRRDLLSHFL